MVSIVRKSEKIMNEINNEFAAGPVFSQAMLSVSAGRYATLVALALGLSLGCGGYTTASSSGAPGATSIGDTAGSLPTSAGETTGAGGATKGCAALVANCHDPELRSIDAAGRCTMNPRPLPRCTDFVHHLRRSATQRTSAAAELHA